MSKVLIFDCDGVLGDTERDGHRPAFNQMWRELGVPWQWSVEEYGEKLKIGGGKERMSSLFADPRFLSVFTPPPNAQARAEIVARWHKRKSAIYQEMIRAGQIPPRSGVKRLCEEAIEHGWILAVASTSAQDSVEAVLRRAVGEDTAARFSLVLAGDVVKHKKPAPDIYILAAERLGVSPSECIVIEDSTNGVAAAVSAKMKCVVTVSGYTLAEDFSQAQIVLSCLGDPDGEVCHVLENRSAAAPDRYFRVADLEAILAGPHGNHPMPNEPLPTARLLRSRMAGVFAPICTPFSDNEEVDYSALIFNVERYAATGLLGFLALGSNGENRSLTESERLAVLRCIIGHKRSGQVVMAGAAYDAQRDAERFLREAAALGADFGLVLSPGYFRKQMTDDVLFRYFSTLADASPIPVILYNAPGFCGVTLSPALVGRLATHPNIVGMKDSASSGIENFLPFESESFHVLAGSANFLFRAMMGGSVGGTVSLANSFPDLALELFHCGQQRDEQRGVPLQERVTRINHAISGPYGPSGVKAAMTLAGFKGGIPRRPLLPLTVEQVEAMRVLFAQEGLL